MPGASSTRPSRRAKTFTISTPVEKANCAYANYLDVLKLATTGTTEVTFSDALVSTPEVTKDGEAICFSTYANVGFQTAGLTKSVEATIACKNADATDCKVSYLPTYACQRDPTFCQMKCTTPGCTPSAIAAGQTLVLKSKEDCPGKFSYLQGLTITSEKKTPFTFAVGGVTPAPVAADAVLKSDTCYYEFFQIPKDRATVAAEMSATITCANGDKACTVETEAAWGCDADRCAKQVPGEPKPKALAIGESFKLTKPEDVVCDDGMPAYPLGVMVGGTYAAHNIAVTFNNGLTPTANDVQADCFLRYDEPVSKNATLTSDVEVTIKCKDTTKPCAVHHAVDEWRCVGASDPEQTYTRVDATGENCKTDWSDCKNRCAKSVEVGENDGVISFTSLLKGSCACPPLTGVPVDKTTVANAETHMSAVYDPDTHTFALAFTGTGEVCTTTYEKAAYKNKFTAKTYTRTSVTPTGDCEKPSDCAYKCAAEFTLTKSTKEKDAIVATRAAVTGCDCKATTAIVGDDGMTARGSDGTTAYLFGATSNVSVALNTTVSATTCYAVYGEKDMSATPVPTTTQPGTSGGMSALGAGAGVCAVTLVAAVAGVQALGVPI